ncbi:helix-turn-helix domain-containing protein [Streptomyces scabiei]|uniref:helix-turn-helix domain-containing protein n=1 Tax=Streptomyces scabiei TaxID=1930 RepID=UPI000A44A202|nr:helix-turn-helix domain-containing protein [Streptomyces scabiei]
MRLRRDYTPVTDDERAEIIRLHAAGKGRNEIARRTGRAQRTVSLICAEEGLIFDTSMTEDATRARIAQLAALRADTAVDLHLDALRLTQQMWEPATIYNFGGKDNTYRDKAVDEPPAIDKKALMTAAGIALEKSLKLVPPNDEGGANDARSMVGQLITGLTAIHRAQQQEAEQATEDEGAGDAP